MCYFTLIRYVTAIVRFWKPPQIQKVSHLKAFASKIISKNFEALPLSIPVKLVGSFFNKLIVHYTKSPVKHCPISKRKIFPDLGD
jgi:hypothetical protein